MGSKNQVHRLSGTAVCWDGGMWSEEKRTGQGKQDQHKRLPIGALNLKRVNSRLGLWWPELWEVSEINLYSFISQFLMIKKIKLFWCTLESTLCKTSNVQLKAKCGQLAELWPWEFGKEKCASGVLCDSELGLTHWDSDPYLDLMITCFGHVLDTPVILSTQNSFFPATSSGRKSIETLKIESIRSPPRGFP